jgi:hypothetical protein
MAIDPIAATGAAADMTAGADLSKESHVAANGGAQQSHPTVSQSETVNIFDYANQQNTKPVPMDALSADGKAQHFANPTNLGEEVLNYLEGFHQRIEGGRPLSERLAAAESSNGEASPGPASRALEATGSAEGTQMTASEQRFEMVLDVMEEAGFRHTETNLVSNVGQQSSKAMNTLMRGQ